MFAETIGAKKTVVVSDSNVAPLYAQSLLAALQHTGIPSCLHVVPAGESYKTLDTVANLYTKMADFGF